MICRCRNKSGPPYGSSGHPMYGPSAAPPSMYGPAGYPKIGQQGHAGSLFPPPARNSPYHHPPSSSSSSSSGLGIKVSVKPESRITPPPQMLPRLGDDAPRSSFQFDFGLERKVLAEADKESQDWSKFGTENLPTKAPESTSSSRTDPVMLKYIASGLNREAVSIAAVNYGDDPTKVEGFAKGFTLLREMGFQAGAAAEALLVFENDTDKALANLLHGSS